MFEIKPILVNGDTAVFIEIRVINYLIGDTEAKIYYALYNTDGTKLDEGNLLFDGEVTGTFQEEVENAVGSTNWIRLLIHTLSSSLYKFSYELAADNTFGLLRLAGSILTNEEAIRESVFDALALESPEDTPYTINTLLPLQSEYFHHNSIPNIEHSFDRWLNGSEDETNLMPAYAYKHSGTPGDFNHEIVCWFRVEWDTRVRRVGIKIAPGYINPDPEMNAPTEIWLRNFASGIHVKLGEFSSAGHRGVYQYFDYPTDPPDFIADELYLKGFNGGVNARGVGQSWGARLKVWGDIRNVAAPVQNRTMYPLKQSKGFNCFVWDATQNGLNTAIVNVMDPAKKARFEQLGMFMIRDYTMRDTWFPSPGVIAAEPNAPTFDNGGGWRGKTAFTGWTSIGVKAILCHMETTPDIYNQPGWGGVRKNKPPVDYANRYDRRNPAVYAGIARTTFMAVAQLGRASGHDPALLGEPYEHPTCAAPRLNVIEQGLNIIWGYEDRNETDAEYELDMANASPDMMAAEASAEYDGHKGTIDVGFGPGVGVGAKNADPDIMFVLPGFSLDDDRAVQNLRGIYRWSRINRGLRPDGTIDVPFDVINLHHYSSNKRAVYESPENEGVLHSCGMPPELSDVFDVAEAILKDMYRYAPHCKFIVSEWGNEDHEYSALGTRQFSTYDRSKVVGIWGIRTMLGYMSLGVYAMQFFKCFASDKNDPLHFRGMEVLEYVPDIYPRTFLADIWMQINPYNDYIFDAWIVKAGVMRVMRLKRPGDGKLLYAIWAVETATPTTLTKYIVLQGLRPAPAYEFAENTGIYNLQLAPGQNVLLRTFVDGGNDMSRQVKVADGAGIVQVAYSAIPVFVSTNLAEPVPNIPPVANAGPDQVITWPGTTSINLNGSAMDADGTIHRTLWTKKSGPKERSRSSSANTFNLGTKYFVIEDDTYLQPGMTDQRAYAKFDGYLIGDIEEVTDNGNGSFTVKFDCTDYELGGEAVLNQEYPIWDLGQDSQITDKNALNTTVTGLVPGFYVFQLFVEDDDFASHRDIVNITVNT